LIYFLTNQAAGNGEGTLSQNWFEETSDSSGDLVLALFSGLWTYNGGVHMRDMLKVGWDNVLIRCFAV